MLSFIGLALMVIIVLVFCLGLCYQCLGVCGRAYKIASREINRQPLTYQSLREIVLRQ